MARLSEIENLEERRRRLRAESDRLRCQLGTEIGQLQAATCWLRTSYSLLQSVRAVWPLIVAGAGFLVARKRGGLLNSLGRLWSIWKMAKKLIHVWQQSSPEASGTTQES